jgi:hypothetical protein
MTTIPPYYLFTYENGTAIPKLSKLRIQQVMGTTPEQHEELWRKWVESHPSRARMKKLEEVIRDARSHDRIVQQAGSIEEKKGGVES